MQQTDCKPIAHSNGAKETEVSKGIGDKQRIYDAMLIKAFRKDVRMTDLDKWLKPYGIKLDKDGLRRVPKSVFWPGRVQEMVGRLLKPLADRLWDTNPMDDIKTLDWMKNLNCQNTNYKWSNDRAALKKDSNNARRKTKLLAEAIKNDKNKKSNQWNVIK